jgi:hypothetical protein
VAASAIAIVLALAAREVIAEDAPSRQEVRMHVAADPLAADAVAEGVRTRLEDQGVWLTWDEVAAIDAPRVLEAGNAAVSPALAEVWLDARAGGGAVLLILPREGDGVLARRLALPSGLDDVAQAEIAFIVERAAGTLLAARPFGVSKAAAQAELEGRAAEVPAAPPAVVKPAPASAAPASSLSFQLGASAGVQTWSASRPWLPAAGLFGAVERAVSWGHLGVAVAGGLRGAADAATSDAQVSVGGGDLHLWLTTSTVLAGGGVWHLSVGPGLFVDRVDVTATPSSSRAVKAASRTDLDPTIGASVRADLWRIGRVAVFVSASADVFPWPGRYTTLVDGDATTLIQPWIVRPSFALGAVIGSR